MEIQKNLKKNIIIIQMIVKKEKKDLEEEDTMERDYQEFQLKYIFLLN